MCNMSIPNCMCNGNMLYCNTLNSVGRVVVLDPVEQEIARLRSVHDSIASHVRTIDELLVRARANIASMKLADSK